MSEIICSYTINNKAEESYFMMDTRVSFNQFFHFIQSNILNENFIIKHTNTGETIHNNEQLNALFNDALQSGALSINIVSLQEEEKIPEPVAPERNEEQEEAKKFLVGPITKNILNQFGIQAEDLNPIEIIQNLPFPFSMIVQTKLDLLSKEPEALEGIVRCIASRFGVSFDELYAEAIETLKALEQPKEPNSPSSQEEEEEKESKEEDAKKFLIGPITTSILNQFGVEIDENLNPIEIIRNLPFPFSMIVQAKLDLLSKEPEALEGIVRCIASRFGVSFEGLYAEAIETLNALKPEQEIVSDENEQVNEVKHSAVCDRCQQWIVGIRYKCLNCPDYDLCATCEEIQAQTSFHDELHVFAKLYKATPYPVRNHCRAPQVQRLHPIMRHFMARNVPSSACPARRSVNEENPNPRPNNSARVKAHQRLQALEETVKQLKEQVQLLQD